MRERNVPEGPRNRRLGRHASGTTSPTAPTCTHELAARGGEAEARTHTGDAFSNRDNLENEECRYY
jgi:hypothetical protein